MAISTARARQICTQSELELVLKSTTRNIGGLDLRQLKAAIRRARTLRDKWRDQAHAQERDTKANSPDKLGEQNARSNDKAQLFDETLGRFEKRLEKLETAAAKKPAVKKAVTKRASSAPDHRGDRAAVRGKLAAKTDLLNQDGLPAPTKTPAKKTPAKKTPVKKAVTKKATASSAAVKQTVTKKAVSKKAISKKKS